MNFPDADTLDAFRRLTLPRDPPFASSSCGISYTDLQALGCVPEEDITVAYHRSFLKRSVVSACEFLYREVNNTLPSTPKTTASPACDADNDWDDFSLSSDSSSQTDDAHDVFYDAVESLECSWFEINM